MRAPPRARQETSLAAAVALLRDAAAQHGAGGHGAGAVGGDATGDVLDAAASRIGRFDLEGYRAALRIEPTVDIGIADAWAAKLLDLVDASGVPRRLALASLAQPEVAEGRRRTTGAYYTDYRLARYLARRAASLAPLSPASTVVDTAAGTGVLLVALAETLGGDDRGAARDLVGHGLSAVDLDPGCRRGTIAALASLTGDLRAITRMARRVRTADSLVADGSLWRSLSADGRFDAVVGNPPWERLRITRHETLRAAGSRRHYGADYEGADYEGAADGGADRGNPSGLVSADTGRLRDYLAALADRYPLLADRETDLCHAFLALGASLLRPGGGLGMLLPAGLIRSKGTRALREHLLTAAAELDITVLHNRSRFFGIDSRFKFLTVCARLGAGRGCGATVSLRHASGAPSQVPDTAPVRIRFADLVAARGDLTIPEVTGERQWRIFRHLAGRGIRPDAPDSPWAVGIVREVDMTRHRRLFRRDRGAGVVPVVEGRMVAQYRGAAKSYVAGSGRAATWRPVPLGDPAGARAQFFVDPARLPATVRERVGRERVGFCDIVGQTNERTVQAALIPAGRVCGNKVPTLDFPGGDRTREMLFLAAANSLVVDWFARRVVTTSLNYFILRGLPLPPLDTDGPLGRRVARLAEHLVAAERPPAGGADRADRVALLTQAARWRAEIDLAICQAYRIDPADLPLLLADFPLLDRGQPPLPGETGSRVTTDLLLGTAGDARAWERYLAATSIGALAYVPEEFATVTR